MKMLQKFLRQFFPFTNTMVVNLFQALGPILRGTSTYPEANL